MNHDLNDPRHPWARLTAGARQAIDSADNSVPYGFATRIAALALSQEQKVVSLMDRFALRALGVAALVMVFSVALNYRVLSTALVQEPVVAAAAEEEVLGTFDAVAVVLDIAD